MNVEAKIMRRWRSRIRSEDAGPYAAYINATGLAEYARTPGNLGCQMLMRDLGDGSVEVTALSWWASLEAIVAFAGPDIAKAVYYPEDEGYLLDMPAEVEHHRIVGAAGVLKEELRA
jgi:heme-degrading monooxygenase HmoA